jgi:nucleoid DNA-binding protein
VTKHELVAAIAAQRTITRREASQCVDVIFSELSKALQEGARVVLPSLGTLTTRTRAARQGRNPRTGQPLTIAAHRVVNFKPATNLKKALTARP